MKLTLLIISISAIALAAPPPSSSRIVGGQDATRNQFAYQISLQRKALLSYSHVCGGSILTHTWIITAAHCTQYAARTYKVVAGILDLKENTADRQEASVSLIVNHPSYSQNSGVGPNDISLIQLAHQLQWTPAVRPVVIPSNDYVPNGSAVLSGWGSMGGTARDPIMPTRLQQANLPIIPIHQCREALDQIVVGRPNPLDDDVNVCSGPLTGGFAACSGDSGGPWVQNGILLGIVSWGMVPCGQVGMPSIYTFARAYRPWIQQYVPDV